MSKNRGLSRRINSWEDIEKYLELECELLEDQSSILEDQYRFYSINGQSKNYQFQKEKKVIGFKSNITSKYKGIREEFNDSVLERIYKLTQIIVSSVGYNALTTVRSSDLIALLGSEYLLILDWCVTNGLFKMEKIESSLSSYEGQKYHTKLSVINRKNKKNPSQFKKYELTSKTAINAFHNYQKASSNWKTERERKVKELTEYNLLASRFIGNSTKEKRMNRALHYLSCRALIGRYCHRVYCLITEITRLQRKNIRPMHAIHAQIKELDIKASHPFFLVQLIQNLGLVRLAFHDKRIVGILEHILYSIADSFSDELIYRLQEAIKKDFYNDFLKTMLNTLDPDWQLSVEDMLTDEDLKKFQKAENKERFLLKRAWAILQNSNPRKTKWTRKMIELMKRNHLYEGLGCLIDEINSESLDLSALLIEVSNNELTGMKKPYMPYKNLGILIFRLESFMMQEVFLRLEGTWCLLIHDAILCTVKDSKKVLECIVETFAEYGIDKPRIDI